MKGKSVLTFVSLLSAALMFSGPVSSANNIKSPIKWSVDKVDMYSRDDSVVIRMFYTFYDSRVAPKSAYVLQPRISDGAHMILLRPVTIYNTSQKKGDAVVRSGNLPASGMERELKLISGQVNNVVVVEDIVPREEWMNKCTISILTSEWEWKDRCQIDRLVNVAKATFPDRISFRCELSPVEPDENTSRTMECSFPLYLEYNQEGQSIIPSMGENNSALMLFCSNITSLLDDPSVTLHDIRIDCWTSPDGYTDRNDKITEGRISSLRQYLSASGVRHLDSAGFTPCGEDWNGMTHWLKKTYYWHPASLDTLFGNHTDRDRIKAILKDRHPDIYADLKEYCFPELDCFVCTIRYEVEPFTSDSQIWEAFNKDIRLLYPHDFWVIARRFPYDTDFWRNILLSSAERFPQDIYANINAAVTLVRMGKYNEASQYISKCLSFDLIDPRAEGYLQYLQGIWQMYAGDPYYGISFLEKFKGRGGYMESAYESALRVIRSLNNNISWDIMITRE